MIILFIIICEIRALLQSCSSKTFEHILLMLASTSNTAPMKVQEA